MVTRHTFLLHNNDYYGAEMCGGSPLLGIINLHPGFGYFE